MSEPKEPKNVRSYRREHLEPEIAAMSVEIDEDEPPALIVNIDDPEAKSGVRKVIVLIGAGLWGLTEWVRRAVQAHPVTVLAGTALATTATAAVFSVVVTDDRQQPPPVAIQRVVTLPASPRPVQTVTATTTRTVSLRPGTSIVAALAKSSPSQAHPPPTAAPASEPTVAPTPRRTPRATRPPKTAPPTQIPSPQPSRSGDTSPIVANETPKPEPEPEPEPPPTDDPPRPTTAAAGCGGLVEVDLDPLPKICLLG